MELVQPHTNGKVATAERWSLVKLDADAVRTLWHKEILPGLLEVKRKDKRSGQWLPEHVRAAIDAGHLGRHFCECHLIVPGGSDKPVGFVVLRLYNDEFVQVPLSLFIWITYCREPRAMKYVIPQLEKRARDIGVRYLDGISSRAAWLRRLRPFGFRCHQMILRKELT